MMRSRLAICAGLVALPFAVSSIFAQGAAPPPGPFDPSVFRERRERVMQEMDGGIAVLYARGEEDRDGFRQDSNFYYLTGVEEAGAVLVLAPAERHDRHWLFLEPRDPEAERWVGEREPLSEALEAKTGFDRVERTSRLEGRLRRLLQGTKNLYVLNQPSTASQPVPKEQELYGKLASRHLGASTKDLTDLLPRMRSVKEPRELERMRAAIEATLAAHRVLAAELRPGVEENWLESVIATEFKRAGAVRPAFSSIVGSGANSTILHYPRHDQTIRDGDLLVVDIGAEYGRYVADVTRTYPASGRFTPEQREIYDLVLRAQEACIAMVKPGVYMEDIHRKAEEIFREAGLVDYFIHGLGHFVGLDVHDTGRYGEPLQAGMVVTVEPGIYLPEKNLGVRIEDEVLVTEKGHELLTGALPRTAEAVEALMRATAAETAR
jgi:Xaa-Pro aminopeptidase